MSKKTNPYAGHRYPTEIISYAVWLHVRFTLSLRDIEELMAYRGVIVTYEAIRQWMLKFGQEFANTLRRRQPRRGDKWHLDEVVLTIKGQHHYLWRAVDQEGYTGYPRAIPARPESGQTGNPAGRRAPPAQGTQQPG